MVRQRQPGELAGWLARCRDSQLRELATFAEGLQHEEGNVRAGLESPYSNGVAEGNVTRLKQIRRAMYGRGNNGVAEGNVTRLKQIRRAMYGRGNFDLLKIRVLVAT